MAADNKEIECRFLEINVDALKKKLKELGATDQGEELIKEIVFYDKERDFVKTHRFVRLREDTHGITLTYKDQGKRTATATEIETSVDSLENTTAILESIGLEAFRHQEKKCHHFTLGKIKVGIDTWPTIPPYVELEADSEPELQQAAQLLGFDWKDADTTSARVVIEERYKLNLTDLRYFTFSRVE